MFLTTFRRFPTTSWRFPKIFQNCSEGLTNFSEHFSNIFRRLTKVAEDFRENTDDVSIIQHHLWVLFERLCSYYSNLKTCDNNLLFSRASERAGNLNPQIGLANHAHMTGPAFYDTAHGPDFFPAAKIFCKSLVDGAQAHWLTRAA